MSISTPNRPAREVTPGGADAEFILELIAAPPQIILGLLPRTCHRAMLWLIGRRTDSVGRAAAFGLSILALGLGLLIFFALLSVTLFALSAWGRVFPTLVDQLIVRGVIDPSSGWANTVPAGGMIQGSIALLIVYGTGLLVRVPYESIGRPFRALRGMLWLRGVNARIGGMLYLMGFGLLPLASLLLFLPLVMPQEAVLSDTQSTAQTRLQRVLRRVFAFLTGLTVLLALLTFGTQVVSWLGLKSEIYGRLATQILPGAVLSRLPPALIQGWPFVLLIMYAADFVLLLFLGKVPVKYNLRNLRVRWLTTTMTGVAFTVVVALLVMMMSFVDSVNKLTAKTGVPGNVIVMSEGGTDELFSNLGYGDVGSLELEVARTDAAGRTLATPVVVKSEQFGATKEVRRLMSRETYFVINQEIAKPGAGPKRRFVQLRGIFDAEVAGRVHDIELQPGGEWFGQEGGVSVGSGQTATPCVLGEGAAAAFGADYGRDTLRVGDQFVIGNLDMIVVGIMKSAGKTFDSETWAPSGRVGPEFGKKSYTTVVIRVSDDKPETMQASAETFATHLTKNFANPRVRAVSEPRYYEDLSKSNADIMFMVVLVAVIMALGGVIGVMLVMFAAIAQRIKDVGVMRVVGYKRSQILVSFMLESLVIAILGGLVGVFLVLALDALASALWGGLTVTSTITAGQGGGKTVVTKLTFGFDVVMSGILFTIVMGRLGGLLPSVGAMRLGILESLR